VSDHPYRHRPGFADWQRAVAAIDAAEVDPVVAFPFQIAPCDAVATAGSCFAQHIARNLAARGLRHFVAEPAHPFLQPDVAAEYNYGIYSCRYGNVYTTRQLLQLFDRAYGRFTPVEDVWEAADGRLVDPFRPRIQPGGFTSRAEYALDREQHFAAVRRMFETLDYLVFTLGLTECWRAREDGAVFPLCPGVSGGTFDSARHEFLNLDVAAITSDLEAFLDRLSRVNPRARVILTVSPVPLVATAEPRHVLESTTVSKAVLRIACDTVTRRHAHVAYFPSYEIVTGPHARGRYFDGDLRSVTETGVQHVMRVFFRHAVLGAPPDTATAPPGPSPDDAAADAFLAGMERAVQVICDEEALRS
jgi:hypothetical protein